MLKSFEFLDTNKEWLYPLIAILVISLVIEIFGSIILNKISKKIQLRNQMETAFIEAVITPFHVTLWVTSLILIYELLSNHKIIKHHDISGTIISVIYVVLASWLCFRWTSFIERLTIQKKRKRQVKDITLVMALSKLAKIVIVVVAVMIVMQLLGYSISALLTFGGIGGLAVSFAAKDLLANFFGGLTIYLDAPFKVGDWIRAPGKPIEGTVEAIGWRQTVIRTFDRRPLYVPNSLFVNMSIENPSRMENRRIKTLISIRYKDSKVLDPLLTSIRHMLNNHPDLDLTRTTFIHFNKFASSSLDCQLYCFTKTTGWVEWLAIQEKVFLAIIKIIHDHGADLAFPTTTIDWTRDKDHKMSQEKLI